MNQTIVVKKKELVREHLKNESNSKKNKINYDQESKYNKDLKQINNLFICGSSSGGVNYII